MFKSRAAALGVLLIASSLAAGCSLLPQEQAPLKPPLVKPAQAEIRTIESKTGSIVKQISGSATFVPTNIEYYQQPDAGVIHSVEARAGSAVKKGDVLVTLENDGVEVELLQREIEYERKKQTLNDTIKAGGEENIRIAKLDFKLAELLYDKAKAKAESSIVRAKKDGVISYATDLEPGDHFDAGRVLMAVAQPDGMRLSLEVTANPALADIKLGMAADVIYKEKTYKGKVTQTPASAPETADEKLRDEYGKTLYIELAKLPEGASFGAHADVTIVAARRDKVIVLPKSAVRAYFGRTFVQVLEGERRKEIDIETGLATATEYEIVKGVQEGMKIILP
ncbi:efflux RND transporter periplasmic adaptor subunit [Paenibacillus rhizovicinus]|uniref:Efflux RND transporter periplasmic adaptor subunit n=1 Tax=Paenibacillus rhizovicinus TaxID=2704463 RepID=A0A6C0PA40_9BACL|nr:efflux RND transporter periplasmic adaptor subunit [Paenibacillus rhizovicinus]QHW34493.1 efflux RND transporter periplasmic adaptor subunit [Paenibacillus rhizovicinus]